MLTVEPFFRMAEARRRELGEQVDRVAVILGTTPVPTIGEVTVGGHAWPVDNCPAMSVLTSRLAA